MNNYLVYYGCCQKFYDVCKLFYANIRSCITESLYYFEFAIYFIAFVVDLFEHNNSIPCLYW